MTTCTDCTAPAGQRCHECGADLCAECLPWCETCCYGDALAQELAAERLRMLEPGVGF